MRDKKNNVLKFFMVSARESCYFFFCKRMYSFFFVWIFLLYIYINPIRRFSLIMHYPASPWGILFIFSNLYFNLVLIAGAIYLFSKVPFMEREQMYQFIRFGRIRWISVQIFKIFVSSLLYTATIFLFGILIMLPHLEWTKEWGRLYYTLALTNAQNDMELVMDISYQLINTYEPISLMILTILVFSLIISFTGLLMFLVSLFFSRTAAVITATFLAIAPIVLENVGRSVQRIMVHMIPTEWLRIAKLGQKNILGISSPDFHEIILCLIIMILMMVIFIYFSGSRISYDWYGED